MCFCAPCSTFNCTFQGQQTENFHCEKNIESALRLFDSDALQEKETRKSFIMSEEQMAPRGKLVFFVGLGALLFVPIFKSLTGLPPYLGMLLGLGVLWVLTGKSHKQLKSFLQDFCEIGFMKLVQLMRVYCL
jgi:hypothetical protein